MGGLQPPEWFEEIKKSAEYYWKGGDSNNPYEQKKREADNNIRKQHFDSVKRPEYVISELLQNADDAYAKKVTIKIDKTKSIPIFTFEHDGRDFDESDFEAICRFSCSNKKSLSTTGCRGIGFKSTFSLNSIVYLQTKSLCVRFQEPEFTIPYWVTPLQTIENTCIKIPIRDSLGALEDSLKLWQKNLVSVYFFKHLEEVDINGIVFKSVVIGEAPVKNSLWLQNKNFPGTNRLLKISSSEIPLPDDIIKNICANRNILMEEELKNSKAVIDLVFGLRDTENLLYATLPTEQNTKLHCSINAPFILNPERNKLAPLGQNLTNVWLFEQVGKLLTESIDSWLNNSGLGAEERVIAYNLIPPISSDKEYDRIVISAFTDYLANNAIVLDIHGEKRSKCFAAPDIFYDIWDINDLNTIYPPSENLPLLLKEAVKPYKSHLLDWGLVTIESGKDVVNRFKSSQNIPKPKSIDDCYELFRFILDKYIDNFCLIDRIYYVHDDGQRNLKIFPCDRNPFLRSAAEALLPYPRLSSLPENYRSLIEKYTYFVDELFIEKIANSDSRNVLDFFRTVYKSRKESSDSDLIEHLSSCNLNQDELITLAHLAAYLNVSVKHQFPYITQDGLVRKKATSIIYDPKNILSSYLPSSDIAAVTLNKKYFEQFASDKEQEDWITWLLSENSKISRPFEIKEVNGNYQFDEDICDKVDKQVEEHPEKEDAWAKILSYLISYQKNINDCLSLRYGGKSMWIKFLSQRRCIYDKSSQPNYPKDVYYENEETALMEGETFANGLYPETACSLLEALGVQFTPGVPNVLLDKLTAYSAGQDITIDNLTSDYQRLDSILRNVSHSVLTEVKNRFEKNSLVFTADNSWKKLSEVYIEDTRNLPNKYLIHPDFISLKFWKSFDVNAAPTLKELIEFLNTLEVGEKVPERYLELVRQILKEKPDKILDEVGLWLSLDDCWKTVGSFSYCLKSKIPGLIDSYKRIIPNLFFLKKEVRDYCQTTYFPDLTDLFEEIRWEVENIDSPSLETEQIPWLTKIGDYFVNRLPSSTNNGDVIRALGTRFLNTRLQGVQSFLKVPYHNSIKIGDGESGEIEYRGTTIYCASSVKKPKLTQYERLFSELTIEKELKGFLVLLIERDDARIFEECNEYFRVTAESDEESTSVPQQLSPSEKRSANLNEFERNIKNAEENESSPSTPVQHQTGTSSSVSTVEMPNQSYECVSNVPQSSNYNLSNLGYESRDRTGGTHRQKNHSVGEAIKKKTVGSKTHYTGMTTKYDEDDAPARAPFDQEKYEQNVNAELDARREEYKINPPKLRSHSVPYEPNDDERNYLNSIYSGKCQICGKTIDLWDGEHYFEAINLLDISNNELRSTYGIGWNSLSLCPNCAVKYKYTGELPEDFSNKICEKPMLTEEEMEDGVDVSITLRGIPADIHYVADHFKNLQTALKKYLEEEEERR